METEWSRVRLADVVESITVGHVGPMAHEYVDAGVPFLRSLNVTAGGIDPSGIRFISPEFHSRLSKSALRAGDVVVVRTGRPGVAAVIDARFDGANCSDMVIIRPGRCVSPTFLAGFINSVAQGHVSAHLVGAVQQHFNVSAARTIELGLPSHEEQRAIASVLRALSDKIESNRRLVRLQRVVRHRTYRRIVDDARDREHLDAIADVVMGSIQPSEHPNAFFEQFSIPAFDAGEDPDMCLGSSMASGKTLLPPDPVVLLSKLNPRTPRIWHPVPSGRGIAVCSPEFVVLKPKPGIPHSWLESCLRSDERFYADVIAAVGGTTGSRQRVKPSDALAATVPVVSGDELVHWAEFAAPLVEREAALTRERRSLTALVDSLLPRLVSGRIRVPLSNDPAEGLGAAMNAPYAAEC